MNKEQALKLCVSSVEHWTKINPATKTDVFNMVMELHKAAYKEGWNDREDDLIMGVRRIMPDTRPDNCRNALRDSGKAYPRSGCAVCKNGGLMGCPYE